MSVYVDSLFLAQARCHKSARLWCHMFADSTDELHAFATSIGVKRCWFEGTRKGLPHYDIGPDKRTAAVSHGAVEVSSFEACRRAISARKRRSMKVIDLTETFKDFVACDACNEEYPDGDSRSGGFVTRFGWAYGPCCQARECEPKFAASIVQRCPPGMSFRDFILRLRGEAEEQRP